MSSEEIAAALSRLEQQNRQILDLLGQIAERKRGKPLPVDNPDFTEVERVLNDAVVEPDVARLLKLDDFASKGWLSQAKVLYTTDLRDMPGYWATVERLVQTISTKAGIPGRVAGSYFDKEDPHRMIGLVLEFGYSREVGYDQPNEFHVNSSREAA